MTVTLGKAIQEYLHYLVQQDKHPRTVGSYGNDLQLIEAFFGAESFVASLSILRVGKFLKSTRLLNTQKGQPKADPSIQKTIRVLRMFLVWCANQGYIEQAPLPKSIVKLRNRNNKGNY